MCVPVQTCICAHMYMRVHAHTLSKLNTLKKQFLKKLGKVDIFTVAQARLKASW